MKIVQYKRKYRTACLNIFEGNIGRYFDVSEFEKFRKFLDSHALVLPYFVVLKDETIVACGGFATADGRASLSWCMVDSNYQRQSIGKRLLRYGLSLLQERHGNIPLSIDTSQIAQGFFEKFGFVPTKVVKDGCGKGLDRVYMDYTWRNNKGQEGHST